MNPTYCPRCTSKYSPNVELKLACIMSHKNEVHIIAECCGSALEELIIDFGLKLSGIKIQLPEFVVKA